MPWSFSFVSYSDSWILAHTKMTIFLKTGFACQVCGGEFMARTAPNPIIRLRFPGPPEEGARWQVHARLGLLLVDLHLSHITFQKKPEQSEDWFIR